MFRKRIYILLISVVNMRIRRKIIIDMQPVVRRKGKIAVARGGGWCYHRGMKLHLSLLCATALAAVALVSCSAPSEFEQIPSTPFTTHLKKNRRDSVPFLSYWEDKAKANPPAATRRKVCLKLNDDYFQGEEQLNRKEKRQLTKLRSYMGRTLRKELRRNPKLRLVDASAKDADVLEVALLRAADSNIAKLLLTQGAGKMVAGGLLTDAFLNNDADKGSVCMAAKVSAPDGSLMSEMADFEYGGKEQSITDGFLSAASPVDPNLFIPFGYQRKTIDKWAKELSAYLATGSFPTPSIPTSLPKIPKPADVLKKAVPTPALPDVKLPTEPRS